MSLARLLEQATPGPWERGAIWSHCGVMPERYGEGKCVHCFNVGTEPVWVGRMSINGTMMLGHRHRVAEPYGLDHLISGANGENVIGNYDYDAGGVIRGEDARLIALTPDMARLLIDVFEDDGKHFKEHVRSALLARFAELNKQAAR